MKIQVIEEDIKNGKPGKPCECPVALAVCRALGVDPSDEYLGVIPEELNFYTHELITKYKKPFKLPKKVKRFIISFDRKESVSPFEFDLPLESEID